MGGEEGHEAGIFPRTSNGMKKILATTHLQSTADCLAAHKAARLAGPKLDKPSLRCRCSDGPDDICGAKATHLVGSRGGIPMPACSRHAQHYKTVKGITVIDLP